MPQITKSTTLNIDEVVYSVEQMSPNVKQMVALMDEWRQEEANQTGQLTMTRAALQHIQNNIYMTVRKEKADAAVAAAQVAAEDNGPANDDSAE